MSFKRLVSVFLMFASILSLCAGTALAAEEDPVCLVSCGEVEFCVYSGENNGCIYAVSEGSETLIADDLSPRFTRPVMLNGRLYYCTDEGCTVSVLPDGSDRKTECSDRGFLMTDGENIYIGDDRHIAKLLPDGSVEILLKVRPLVNEGYFTVMNMIECMCISGDKIYYTLKLAELFELREIGTDGTGDRRIGDTFKVIYESAGLYPSEDGSEIIAAYYCNGQLCETAVKIF